MNHPDAGDSPPHSRAGRGLPGQTAIRRGQTAGRIAQQEAPDRGEPRPGCPLHLLMTGSPATCSGFRPSSPPNPPGRGWGVRPPLPCPQAQHVTVIHTESVAAFTTRQGRWALSGSPHPASPCGDFLCPLLPPFHRWGARGPGRSQTLQVKHWTWNRSRASRRTVCVSPWPVSAPRQ